MFRFFDWLFPPRVDEALLREVSADAFLAHLSPRLSPVTRPGSVVLLPFHLSIVRAAIHEAKYHGSPRAYRYLGLALAEYVREMDDAGGPHARVVIVPVPLGAQRLKKRGWNQVEEIARSALAEFAGGRSLSIDPSLLYRTRDTVSQVSLPRHTREENMRGAFATSHLDPACTYLLVDDVLTTGATLQAAIDALSSAGAKHIVPLALAH